MGEGLSIKKFMNCGVVIYMRSFLKKCSYYNKKEQNKKKEEKQMSGKLIIEGNAVYELDEECMLRKKTGSDR